MGSTEKTSISFKVFPIGDAGVGKTSLALRYTEDRFEEKTRSSLGIDFSTKNLTRDGQKIQLNIWDTAGMERFRSFSAGAYRNCDCIIFAFDLTDLFSFKNIEFWHMEAIRGAPLATKILVGTKSDRSAERTVPAYDIEAFCEKNEMIYFETSSKDSTNVNSLFEEVVSILLKKSTATKLKSRSPRITLDDTSSSDANSGCAC
eukprot:TRINITY_DN7415_c0_g1_i1.p1 TRINITY_DN7415_c0_g1~~TRINITY_DN7415_c0_g1_i1.p1  ORF type:complete len:203 (+),score=86.93 TRINITY_DN7415_c0_g1_i1:108-716(+)